ncbi:MAG: PEP-CTERM sorting domain-containing protein [Planctomycetota bacterium]
MMKKLLVFMMVFVMASMASAALQISVDGVQNPVDSQINIGPSDELNLGIWTDSLIEAEVGEGYFGLVVNLANGSIDLASGVALIEDDGITVEHGFGAADAGLPLPAGVDGSLVGVFLTTTANIAADATIFDGFIFHCEGLGDAIIQIVAEDGTVIDSVIVHQIIPEPMTLALLGLGGLFLKRRK